MNTEKKNQHFVPRSLLKRFAIDSEESLIWGYDKKYGKCTGKRSISRICSFDYYYEQLKPDGSKTQVLEEELGTVEKAASEIIRNLFTRQKLSSEEKGCLAFYIGLLLTRGPSFRDSIHELHKHVAEITLQELYEAGRLPELAALLKVNNDITSAVKTAILPHVSLQYMIESANEIGLSLCRKKWNLYCIPNNSFFITSDTPVMFQSSISETRQAVGPAHPQSLVLCPITKKMLIAARPYCRCDCGAYQFMQIKDEMVGKVNELMCLNAQIFIYSFAQSEELLGYIKKAKQCSKKSKCYRFDDAIILNWDMSSSD